MGPISFRDGNSGQQIGINNAPINTHIYMHPEHPQNSILSPVSTVPFSRDPDFVTQGTILDKIDQKIAQNSPGSGSRFALVGLGGIGKSQLAIEYTYRIRDRSPETWILWVHSSSAVRFQQSCREIVDRLDIPSRQITNANIFELFQRWLQDSRTPWVLVLDGLDNDDFLHRVSPPEKRERKNDSSGTVKPPIWDFFRDTLPGSILITSRSKRVAFRLVEEADIFVVGPMDAAGATALLKKKLGPEIEKREKEMTELTTALELMPLAIVQAASYIKQRAPRVTVAQYLEVFRKSDRKKISLLSHDGGHLRRDKKASNAIFITWQSSFDQIREVHPSAANILALMSFFDPQGIPDTLILSRVQSAGSGATRVASESDEECASESSSVETFEDDILVLRNYSLITVSIDGRNFEMHGLVQLAMCEWLKSQGQLERWKNVFIDTLYCCFPSEPALGDVNNWPKCQSLFPHVECAVAHIPNDEEYLQKWCSLCQNASSYARLRGYIRGSIRMAKLAYKARKEIFGSDHESTLDSAEVLCLAQMLDCQWKEAETLALRVAEIRTKLLGLHHSATLTSQHNLASIYLHQVRWKECEKLQMQVLNTRIQIFGPQHPDTIMSMASLAFTHCIQARYKQAEALGLKVVASYKGLLGIYHPATLASMHNLASAYWYQGRLEVAGDLWQQVMRMNMEVLGSFHPNTLTIMMNLAMLYYHLGRLEEAAGLGYQAMHGRRHVHGLEYPDTLISIFNLAFTYHSQGRLKESEDLFLQLIATHEWTLNQTYPNMTCIGNLATIYRQKGRLTEAEELGYFVMQTRTRNLGPDHPLTQFSIAGLASTYRSQLRIKDAEFLESKLQDIDESIHLKGYLGELDEEIGNYLGQEISLNIARTEKNNGDGSHQEQDSLVAHGHATYCRHFSGDIAFQYMGAWTGGK